MQALNGTISDLKLQLRNRTELQQQAEQQLVTAAGELAALTATHQQLHKQLGEEKQHHTAALQHLQLQLEQQQQAAAQQQAQSATHQTLQQQLAEVGEQLSALQQQHSVLEQQHSALEQQHSALQLQHSTLAQQQGTTSKDAAPLAEANRCSEGAAHVVSDLEPQLSADGTENSFLCALITDGLSTVEASMTMINNEMLEQVEELNRQNNRVRAGFQGSSDGSRHSDSSGSPNVGRASAMSIADSAREVVAGALAAANAEVALLEATVLQLTRQLHSQEAKIEQLQLQPAATTPAVIPGLSDVESDPAAVEQAVAAIVAEPTPAVPAAAKMAGASSAAAAAAVAATALQLQVAQLQGELDKERNLVRELRARGEVVRSEAQEQQQERQRQRKAQHELQQQGNQTQLLGMQIHSQQVRIVERNLAESQRQVRQIWVHTPAPTSKRPGST